MFKRKTERKRQPAILLLAKDKPPGNKVIIATASTATTKDQVISGSNTNDSLKVAGLQTAIIEAATKASSLKSLYGEGIIARNTYLDAEAKAEKLRNQLRSVNSKT